MPTSRVGRFASNRIPENEKEELNMTPATTKKQDEYRKNNPQDKDELSDIDFMTSPPSPSTPTARINNAKLNAQSNSAFVRPMMNKISDVVTKEDLASELVGLNKIEGIEMVYVSVRFAKGDQFEPDRKVAYVTAYNPLDNKEVTIASSAWQVVKQLEVAEAKDSFPFLATGVLVSTDGKRPHWELE